MQASRNLTPIEAGQMVLNGYIGQAIHARRPHGNIRSEVNRNAATGQEFTLGFAVFWRPRPSGVDWRKPR
jgi:hypothetical protein